MHYSFASTIFIVVLCMLLSNTASGRPGEVRPRSVEIEIGGSVNITCHMNLKRFKGKDSSSLYFVSIDESQRVSRVTTSDIAIIDKSTIVYMLRNAVEQKRSYRCHCGEDAINETSVSVGTKPLLVTNFKCRGYDYIYMECTFSKPNNTISTEYKLTYTWQDPNYRQNCSLQMSETSGFSNLTGINYQLYHEFFNFTLEASNALGMRSQNFWINHYESVIPARPNFVVEAIHTDSVVLKWTKAKLNYKEKGLQFKVLLCPDGFNCTKSANYSISRIEDGQYMLKLGSLLYAYYWYNVSLRIRVNSSNSDESLWSEPDLLRFQTKACPPPAPPATDMGSFYIDASRERVRLYWRQLPAFQQNGPNFRYAVTRVKRDGKVIELAALTNDSISSTFAWQKEHGYEFSIISQNDVGGSSESSRLVVPIMQRAQQIYPQWIRNVYHHDNRTYTISWSPPVDVKDLRDYTIFWCPSKQANTNECKKSIQFKHVNKNVNYFMTEKGVEDVLNFAVSANYANYNSGMHWTMCSVEDISELEKMEPEVNATTSRGEIELQWRTDRVCNSLLEGYILTYCPVDEEYKCWNDSNTTVNIEKTAKKYLLRGLQAFTTYKINILMYSKQKNGAVSDAKFITTIEEAPSPPRDLKYYNITSNSAWISWTRPSQFNGILKYYTIVQNNEHHRFNCTEQVCHSELGKEMKYKLENLSSYTNYKVYITAHTTTTSEPSNDIHLMTLIGLPSNPRNMSIEHNVIQWSHPEVPSGRVEFYEVSVIMWYKDEKRLEHISTIESATSCTINLPPCKDASYRYTFRVRAVNVAQRDSEIDLQLYNADEEKSELHESKAAYHRGDDELLCKATSSLSEGPRYSNVSQDIFYRSVWENGPIYGCAAVTAWKYLLFMTVTFLALFGILCYKYGYGKYRKMGDIDCKLPEGLDTLPIPTKETGFDNRAISKEAENNIQRSKELLLNNESHRLLAGIDVQTSCSIGKSSGYMGSDELENYEESNPASDDAYVGMDTTKYDDVKLPVKQTSGENVSYVKNFTPVPTVNCYVCPSVAKHMFMVEEVPKTSTLLPKDNGYIKPSNPLMSWQPKPPVIVGSAKVSNYGKFPTSDCGYVAAHAPKTPSHDGYTTEFALTKRTQLPTVAQTAASAGNISDSALGFLPKSGYVTQRELSDFAHSRIS